MAEARRARPLLGTLVEIHALADGSDIALMAAVEAAFAVIAEVHNLMSVHDPASEASRLNRTAHRQPVTLGARTHAVLTAALRFSEESAGAFDMVVGARLQALGLLPALGDEAVADAGCWRDIEFIGERAVRFHRPLRLDFGGIAKGYAVDCAVAVLRSAGVRSALVNAGGDLRAVGALPQTIDIRAAQDPSRSAHRLALQEQAMATSATYFSQRLDAHGQLISALIDPHSRRAYTGHDSVSVIASDCMTADALTKVVLFASDDCSAKLLERHGAQAFVQHGALLAAP